MSMPSSGSSTWRSASSSSFVPATSVTVAASALAGAGPEVDAAVHGVPVDLRELVAGELEPVERGDVRLELLDTRCADQRRGDPLVAQDPGERELRERLPAAGGDLVQRPNALERVV